MNFDLRGPESMTPQVNEWLMNFLTKRMTKGAQYKVLLPLIGRPKAEAAPKFGTAPPATYYLSEVLWSKS